MITKRKKLKLKINKPEVFELLYDEPLMGENKYGKYFLYTLMDENKREFTFYAPDKVHGKMKMLKKGTKVELTKMIEKEGTKEITTFNVKILLVPKELTYQIGNDDFYALMLQSYKDALRIRQKLGDTVDVNRAAISIFISRSKKLS